MELVVGRVAKSHGIRGEVAVEVRTDSPEERFAVGAVLRARRPRRSAAGEGPATREYTVEAAREHSGRLLLRLRGVDDRSAADALRGTLFLVESADLPPSDDPDEFYDHELEGLAVLLPDGTRVGTVTEVVHTAGAELLAVRLDAGDGATASAERGGEALVPFVSEIVTAVSAEEGALTIDPPPGLLDLSEADSAGPAAPGPSGADGGGRPQGRAR